jgi:AraC-like DNA-binding protein
MSGHETLVPGEANSMRNVLLGTRDWEQLAKEAGFKPARMAQLCAMSERHLQRLFKQYFRSTPRFWLRELQCRLAKDLIAHGYSSKAAAAELNFATQAHFCREFKKIHGASPQCFAPDHLGLRSRGGLTALRNAAATIA